LLAFRFSPRMKEWRREVNTMQLSSHKRDAVAAL
jgi:hypothetical protein